MHRPGQPLQTETSVPDAQTSVEQPEMEMASVTPEPGPVSPVGFAGLAALIGLAAGMVLAPWLERFYQHAVKHNEEEHDE